MGTSTNAILFYGFTFGEEKPWVEDLESEDSQDEEGWEEAYAKAMGLERPEEPFPPGVRNPKTYNYDHTPEEQPVIDRYRAFWDAKRKLVEKSGVEIGTHCSCDYPMYYVCVSESELTAHRGDEQEVKSLDVDEDWDEKLKAFCKTMKIKIGNKKPRWWLVSNWC